MSIFEDLKDKYLKYNNLEETNSLIIDSSFIACINKKIHNISIPNNITTLGYRSFCDCINLKSLDIPENVSNIEKGAFYNCHNLQKINLPKNIIELKKDTFSNCFNLRNIDLPRNLYYIGEECFFNCEKLSNVNLPDNLKHIDKGAFKNCYNLTDLVIPNSVENISSDVFVNCINLENIILPNSIKSLESSLFNNCKKINKINIPKTVDKIEDFVFFNCSNLSDIELPENLSSIGSKAFSNCINLKNITIPNSVSSIGQSLFSNCKNLKSIKLSNIIEYIPSSTFENCKKLEDIHIPESIKKIDNSAFLGCKNIKNISLPKDLESLGSNVFDNCYNLKNINLSKKINTIGASAFYNCTNLEEIILPQKVETLKPFTFYNCTSLKKVRLPKSLSKIAGYCFSNCESLNEIILPDRLQFISSHAFSNCESLESITLPKSIKYIKEHSFNNCKNLKKIIIPEGIKYISNSAFENCSNIVIYGKENSYAHRYALDNKIKFKKYDFIHLKKIELDSSFVSMLNNEEKHLKLLLYPKNTNDIFKVRWTSSDENIVSVKNGIIKSHNIGVVTITATAGYNKIAKCVVSVERPLERISFKNSNISLNRNESKSLKLDYFPANHTCTETPIWISSDETVAKVDSSGNILGINKGNCTITCSLANQSATCNINVKLPLEQIVLDKSNLDLKCQESYKLNISYVPCDTTENINLDWSSLDPSIASIDKDGTVKALKTGTTVITASANNKIATCIVSVKSSLSQIKFKDDKINLKFGELKPLEVFDDNNNKISNELINWRISDNNIAKIEDNCIKALNSGTTVLIAQFENLIATCILNISLQKIRLFDINYLKSSSNIITGKGIKGASVKAFKDNKLISDTCVIGEDKRFLLNIEKQDAGSEIKIEIAKNGYETRTETITSLYEFDVFTVDSIETIDSTHINIIGKGLSGSHIRAYIRNTQIGKTAVVNPNGTFNIYLPRLKANTHILLKMRKTNYVTANKNVVIP